MQIEFERTGGFAGLRLATVIDSTSLSPEEARQLDQLLEAANFFELPAEMMSTGPGADRFLYSLTIIEGTRRHTVRAGEAAIPERLRDLLNWLTSVARRKQ